MRGHASAASHRLGNEALKYTAVATVTPAMRLPTIAGHPVQWYGLAGSAAVVTSGNKDLRRIRLHFTVAVRITAGGFAFNGCIVWPPKIIGGSWMNG
jgi:hypothetical protein